MLAANLLCRLPEPMAFLARLPSLMRPGGVVIIISPYSWLEEYTPKNKWIGGRVDPDGGVECRSRDGLIGIMTELGFEMIESPKEMPFLIREHIRKYQWGVSDAQIWRLREGVQKKVAPESPLYAL